MPERLELGAPAPAPVWQPQLGEWNVDSAAAGVGESYDITVFVSGSIIEVFVNDRVALANRLYDHEGLITGLFVEEGAGRFSSVSVRELPLEVW